MNWSEIRLHYPKTWLLVEVLQAHTENDKRILEQLAVINTFSDVQEALKSYAELHQHQPNRELFVLHTDREELDITVRHWFGLRKASPKNTKKQFREVYISHIKIRDTPFYPFNP